MPRLMRRWRGWWLQPRLRPQGDLHLAGDLVGVGAHDDL